MIRYKIRCINLFTYEGITRCCTILLQKLIILYPVEIIIGPNGNQESLPYTQDGITCQ